MPLIDGVAIVGKHPKAVGIEANGTTEITLIRVHVRETQCGVHLTGKSREVIISNYHFFENPNVTITGNILSDVKVNVHLKGCRGVTIVGSFTLDF